MAEQRTVAEVIGVNVKRLRGHAGRSQDDLARGVRVFGVNWSRSVVAALESGGKVVDVGELVALCLALGATPDQLLADIAEPGEGPGVLLTNNATALVKLGAVRWVLEGKRVDVSIPAVEDEVFCYDDTSRPDTVQEEAETAWAFGGEPPDVAVRESRGEPERDAARRLGVPAVQVALAARMLWRRSLTAERDARLETQTPADNRSRAARRNHITRKLLAELRELIEKGEPNGLD